MLEFQQFNTLWDQVLASTTSARRSCSTRCASATCSTRTSSARASRRPAHRPKASKELLDLRRKQVMVAKQGDYADAQKLKTRADALEAEEAERREREVEARCSPR